MNTNNLTLNTKDIHIYYINLDHRRDRNINVIEQLIKYNYFETNKITRVSGINGNNINRNS